MPEVPNLSLAEYITALQYHAGPEATEATMAEGLGVQQQTLQGVLNGEIPSAPFQMLLADKLELGVDEFEAMLRTTRMLNLKEFVVESVARRMAHKEPMGFNDKLLAAGLLSAVGIEVPKMLG